MNNDSPITNAIMAIVGIVIVIAFWLMPIVILAWLIAFFLKGCK